MSNVTACSVENLSDLNSLPQSDLIDAITEGLPAKLVRQLADIFNLRLDETSALLRLNARTLQRRFDEGTLTLAESERLWELSHLFFRAEEVLESKAAAANWFHAPLQALGWATPLAFAQTAVGLRELEKILGRIEHGIFS